MKTTFYYNWQDIMFLLHAIIVSLHGICLTDILLCPINFLLNTAEIILCLVSKVLTPLAV